MVDDADDVRLPLHNDDIFQHGITFPVKVEQSLYNYQFCDLIALCNAKFTISPQNAPQNLRFHREIRCWIVLFLFLCNWKLIAHFITTKACLQQLSSSQAICYLQHTVENDTILSVSISFYFPWHLEYEFINQQPSFIKIIPSPICYKVIISYYQSFAARIIICELTNSLKLYNSLWYCFVLL